MKRRRNILWKLATDKKAVVIARRRKIKGGVSGLLEQIVTKESEK